MIHTRMKEISFLPAETVVFFLGEILQCVLFCYILLGGFAGQSDLHLWSESGSCEGGAEVWDEG